MEPNTQRQRPLSVPCDQIGRLSLIGVLSQVATFMAVNLRILNLAIFKKRMDEKFETNSIVTEPLVNPYYNTTAVFQCEFQGQLRNPRGLLKSVRTWLQEAIDSSEKEAMAMALREHEAEISEEEECSNCGAPISQCHCIRSCVDMADAVPSMRHEYDEDYDYDD